jgi:hypothetical protein
MTSGCIGMGIDGVLIMMDISIDWQRRMRYPDMIKYQGLRIMIEDVR